MGKHFSMGSFSNKEMAKVGYNVAQEFLDSTNEIVLQTAEQIELHIASAKEAVSNATWRAKHTASSDIMAPGVTKSPTGEWVR